MSSTNNSKGEQYNLRWNNFFNNMVQIFSDLKHQEQLIDVTLLCEEQEIKAHKIILAACSDFFMDLFTNISDVHPIIKFFEISLSNLKQIIDFIYQGEVKVIDADLQAVLQLGEMFRVKGLSAVKIQGTSSNDTSNKPVKYTILSPHPKSEDIKNLRPPDGTIPYTGDSDLNNGSAKEPATKKIKTASSIATKSDIEEPIVIDNNTCNISNKESLKDKSRSLLKLKDKRKINSSQQTVLKSPKQVSNSLSESSSLTTISSEISEEVEKPNAFILFCNEWRKKLIIEHPDEDYKTISVRLGNLWKSLTSVTKESYYSAARELQSSKQPISDIK